MNKIEKNLYKIVQLKNICNHIENIIEYNQNEYKNYIKKSNDTNLNENDKQINKNKATEYIEKNEILTNLLNKIHKII